MDEKMQAAIDEFIGQRINDHSYVESESLSRAYDLYQSRFENVREALPIGKKNLANELENGFSMLDGEIQQFYYRAGFADAVSFICEWRDGQWS